MLLVQGCYATSLIAQENSITTCFSPAEKCEDKFLEFLKSAKTSIQIAVYDIDLPSIIDVLSQKAQENVSVKIVTDPTKAAANGKNLRTLQKAGIKIRTGVQEGHMHNKFVIIDGIKVETGSFNFTKHSYHKNQENQLYIMDAGIAAKYVADYSTLWESSTKI